MYKQTILIDIHVPMNNKKRTSKRISVNENFNKISFPSIFINKNFISSGEVKDN